MSEMRTIGEAVAVVVDTLESKMGPWKHWRDWLAHVADPNKPPVEACHAEQPQCGFYRMSSRDRVTKVQRLVPVAIWEQAGVWYAKIEDRTHTGDLVNVAWQRVIAPITEEVYRAVAERGELWPDIDPVVSEQINPREAPGGNNPPQDKAEILREQIDAAKARLADYAKIDTDEKCNAAQTLRARLLELSGKADKLREAEKRPHLDAGKAIDAKYQPLVKDAKDGADTVKKAMEAFQTEKLRKQREEERKAAEAAAAAEKAARDAAAAAEQAGLPVENVTVAPPAPPQVAPRAAPAVKGAFGRAASVKAAVVLGEVTDWAALFAYFSEQDEVRALLRKLAERAIAAGQTVPGTTTTEKAKVA